MMSRIFKHSFLTDFFKDINSKLTDYNTDFPTIKFN